MQRAWLLQHMCEPSFAQRGEVPENVWPKQVAEAATQGQPPSRTQFAELQADPELEAAMVAASPAPASHHDEDGARPTASRPHTATCTRCGQTTPISQKLRCVRPLAAFAPFSSRIARLRGRRRLRHLRRLRASAASPALSLAYRVWPAGFSLQPFASSVKPPA